jgi:tRNA modification GTPase
VIKDTIVAQATAPGRGGIGVVRVSGQAASIAALSILGTLPPPRQATYLPFCDNKQPIDFGIAIFYQAPNSFTGEDVLELQGHGGQTVLDMLIETLIKLPDVRIANPGEFSERAFLNNKLDLLQAEAIMDLIDASSKQSARSALNSLQGKFSTAIADLTNHIIELRLYVEAAIDFPDEDIDFIADNKINNDLQRIISNLENTLTTAKQGNVLKEGMSVVLAGKPNAGKSSLLNLLAERDIAIVTDIKGTTRDLLEEQIHINGIPLRIIDTAGLRDSDNPVEQIGIDRAWKKIENADQVLLIVDSTDTDQLTTSGIWQDLTNRIPQGIGVTIIRNKIDLTKEPAGVQTDKPVPVIGLSTKTGEGFKSLKHHLQHLMRVQDNTEGIFMARRRHIQALETCLGHLQEGQSQLSEYLSGEILAEELRLGQQELNQITGDFTSDDLLGRIFSSFCIGK